MVTDDNYTYNEHFIVYINAESLFCSPETIIIFYVNSSSIKFFSKITE